MMPLHEFVSVAARLLRDEDIGAVVGLVECDGIPAIWSPYGLFSHTGAPGVGCGYLNRSPLVAAVYPDGSAQLLSRDEDECRLFATLWELER